jgi:hypothetical protein
MEGWLALTEELAASTKRLDVFDRPIPNPIEAKDCKEETKEVMLHHDVFGKLFDYDNDENIEILSKLKARYNRVMYEIQLENLAGRLSNRTIMWGVVILLLVYETAVTTFIVKYVDLQVNLGILFTVYTLTSAGFGNVAMPKTDGFLIFLVFNVFISVTLLAILVRSPRFIFMYKGIDKLSLTVAFF